MHQLDNKLFEQNTHYIFELLQLQIISCSYPYDVITVDVVYYVF
jgi:hypothetical protein